jgi:hypothetical protein
MEKTFEYTFDSIDMTVSITIDYSEYDNWLDENHRETFIDNVEIIDITCGMWDVKDLILENAPAKVLKELENTCWDEAGRD